MLISYTKEMMTISVWDSFNETELNIFVDQVYRDLVSMRPIMPHRMQYVVELMTTGDWLRSYAELGGVGNALDGISGRMRFENNLAGAFTELEANYDCLEQGFLEFFPDLLKHVEAPR